ncbi:MAG: hypothetical protein JRI80_00425 [Deltaproteobacteria bacterium]|nr:hypothetical protein [Deltaproteobacteria bacterium]
MRGLTRLPKRFGVAVNGAGKYDFKLLSDPEAAVLYSGWHDHQGVLVQRQSRLRQMWLCDGLVA